MPRDDSDDEWNDDRGGTGRDDNRRDTGWDDQPGTDGPPDAGGQPGTGGGSEGPPGRDDGWRDDRWDDPNTLTETRSLQLSELFSEGVDALLSTTGLMLTGLMWVMTLLSTIVTESMFAAGIEYMRDVFSSPEMRRELEGSGITQEELLESLDSFEVAPLALDLPVWMLLLALLLLPIISEAIQIVAVRAFAAGERDGISGDLARRRILVATLLGWFGGILLAIGIGIGLLLLIVPGIFIAVVTIFYRQEIAVADKGLISGIQGSWNLTKGNRIELFGLMVILFGIAWVVSILVGFVLPGFSIVSSVTTTITNAVLTIFSIAVVTAAYVQLGGEQQDSPDRRF